MKQQYIPLEKRSKREQKEYFAARRRSWGDVNPVTRKPQNPKAYKRKKSGQRHEHEPLSGFRFAYGRNHTLRCRIFCNDRKSPPTVELRV